MITFTASELKKAESIINKWDKLRSIEPLSREFWDDALERIAKHPDFPFVPEELENKIALVQSNEELAKKEITHSIVTKNNGKRNGIFNYYDIEANKAAAQIKDLISENEELIIRLHAYYKTHNFIESKLEKKDLNFEEYINSSFFKLLEDLNEEFYIIQAAYNIYKSKGTKAKRPDSFLVPVDKVNSISSGIWTQFEEDLNGQYQYGFNVANTNSKTSKPVNIIATINFDALNDIPGNIKLSRKLTPFDRRVYNAAAALYNAGNEYISITQIYKTIGNTGRPSQNQIDKISNSIKKMRLAQIEINNSEEQEAKYNYPKYEYEGQLLPHEIMKERINGKLTEEAIHLLREPPLMQFARARHQVEEINRKVLESPISKTDANILLEEYLIERICRIKSTRNNEPTVLISTILNACGINSRLEKSRTIEKIIKLMDHYKTTNFINDYRITLEKTPEKSKIEIFV